MTLRPLLAGLAFDPHATRALPPIAALVLVAAQAVQAVQVVEAAPEPPAIEVVAGVRHVRNGSEPLAGERTLRLEELWSVNVDEEEELIGVLSSAISGSAGTLWLTDNQLGQVLVYSATGEHLRTLSREGEGPGELNHPQGMFWLPDGGLGIQDRKRGQLTRIDAGGVPLSSIQLAAQDGQRLSTSSIQDVRCRGGVLAVSGMQFGNREDGKPFQSRYLGIFDLTGNEIARLREKPAGFDFAGSYDESVDWFPSRNLFDLDAAGRLHVAAGRDLYRIVVHDPGGAQVGVIERAYEPRRRTAEEKDEVRANVTMWVNGREVKVESKVLETVAPIQALQILDDGMLWVTNGHGMKPAEPGAARSCDLFDAEGRFQEVVHVAVAMDPDQDRLIHLDDGRWILLRNVRAAWNAMYGRNDEDAEDADAADTADAAEDAALKIVCLRGE
ncbi:MAG: hypothetical protein R6X25_14215 [Candidatus Krumholzibacteriia bacterium]